MPALQVQGPEFDSEDPRIPDITLVCRILGISLQLIRYCDVPDGKEDEHGSRQEHQRVAEGQECEFRI